MSANNLPTISSLRELHNLLDTPCTFITIHTVTYPKSITKKASINCACGKQLSYERVVNNRLKKEGSSQVVKPKQRQWGSRIPNTPFVYHKGRHYLEVLAIRPTKTEYFDRKNLPLTLAQTKEVLKSRMESNPYSLDNPPKWRTYKLESIKQITVNKKTYNVNILE